MTEEIEKHRRRYNMRYFFFFSSRRRHTRLQGDWSSDVCSSDLAGRGTRRGCGAVSDFSTTWRRRMEALLSGRDGARPKIAPETKGIGEPDLKDRSEEASCRGRG